MESQFFLDFIYEIYKKIRMESQFFLDFIYEIYKKIRMDGVYVKQIINKLIFCFAHLSACMAYAVGKLG